MLEVARKSLVIFADLPGPTPKDGFLGLLDNAALDPSAGKKLQTKLGEVAINVPGMALRQYTGRAQSGAGSPPTPPGTRSPTNGGPMG